MCCSSFYVYSVRAVKSHWFFFSPIISCEVCSPGVTLLPFSSLFLFSLNPPSTHKVCALCYIRAQELLAGVASVQKVKYCWKHNTHKQFVRAYALLLVWSGGLCRTNVHHSGWKIRSVSNAGKFWVCKTYEVNSAESLTLHVHLLLRLLFQVSVVEMCL